MIVLITGGSGSGKSEYGETLAGLLAKGKELIYVATMQPGGEETKQKIKRHQAMRAGKGFRTVECATGIKALSFAGEPVILLECLSNLLANELYAEEGAGQLACEEIVEGIDRLAAKSSALLVISNEIFQDSQAYSREMECYRGMLGRLNQRIGERADRIVEVVYSLPVYYKGEPLC